MKLTNNLKLHFSSLNIETTLFDLFIFVITFINPFSVFLNIRKILPSIISTSNEKKYVKILYKNFHRVLVNIKKQQTTI